MARRVCTSVLEAVVVPRFGIRSGVTSASTLDLRLLYALSSMLVAAPKGNGRITEGHARSLQRPMRVTRRQAEHSTSTVRPRRSQEDTMKKVLLGAVGVMALAGCQSDEQTLDATQ